MNLAAKIATGVSVIVVVGLGALGAPAITAAWTATVPLVETAADALASPEPSSEPTVEPATDAEKAPPPGIAPGGPLDADGRVRISLGGGVIAAVLPGECIPVLVDRSRLLGTLIDHGESEYAHGTVIHSEDGRIKAYEVASGDTLWAIGTRFCMSHAHIFYANDLHKTGQGSDSISPGQVLILDPGA